MVTDVRLSDLDQWCAWTTKQRKNGTWAKIPVSLTGRYALVNDLSTWGTLAEAQANAQRRSLRGIGFVLAEGDPFTVVDLDACVIDGRLSDLAAEIVGRLNTYAEYSPSGRGVHVWVKTTDQPTLRSEGIEIYSHSRFCTLTGKRLPDTPNQIATVDLDWLIERHREQAAPAATHTPVAISTPTPDDDRLWRLIWRVDRTGRAEKLYRGDLSVVGGDHSLGVITVLNTLAKFTQGNRQRMKRMIAQTSLPPEKWDRPLNGSTWLDHQIENCVSYTGAR